MKVTQTKNVNSKFDTFPTEIKSKLHALRNLIIETAEELNIDQLEETLKWGEPSYLTPKGSTIRLNQYKKEGGDYAIFFKCTSKLVVCFKEVFGDTFNYETTRAIVFKMNDKVPQKELKKCIAAALQYHTIKNLPLLGL